MPSYPVPQLRLTSLHVTAVGELKKNLTETKFVVQRQKRLNIIFEFQAKKKEISLEKNGNMTKVAERS